MDVDPRLLVERAAIAGLAPNGTISWGGGTRLLRATDNWVAVSLTREEDVELVPALIEDDVAGSAWPAVARFVARHSSREVVERSTLLGLPAAALGEATGRAAVACHRIGDGPRRRVGELVVADLSSLWAGPLCGALLADTGADVIKVESTSRPDGARSGPQQFFDLMNGAKRSFAVDFAQANGRARLRRLLDRVDVVVEGSRRRALDQLGIERAGPQVWVSITGHGLASDRVAFGDDAAVAGGLVQWDGDTPHFFGDAIADPLSGITAATAVTEVLQKGGRWHIDVAMAGVAASFVGRLPALPPPRARHPAMRAPELGEHTDEIVAQFGM